MARGQAWSRRGWMSVISCFTLLLMGSFMLLLLFRRSALSHAPPPLPTRAFFITTQARHDSNWTSYTLGELTKRRNILNIKRLDMVFTHYDGEFGPAFDEKTGVRPELAVAHLRVWEQIVAEGIESAWVFEDDIVFHDDFETLFPLYWAGVPHTYEFVYVGQSPMGENLPACQVRAANMTADKETDPRLKLHPQKLWQVKEPVFCTHALAISKAGARRAALAMRHNIWTMNVAKRSPHYVEVNVDIVLENIHRFHLTAADKFNWVAFDPTVDHMAKWGGLEWCRMSPHQEWPGNCTCETCMLGREPWVQMQVPLYGTGLIFHNFCRQRPGELEVWREKLAAAVAGGALNPDPVHGMQWERKPFTFWQGGSRRWQGGKFVPKTLRVA